MESPRDPLGVLPMAMAVEMMDLSVWRIDLRNGRIYANAHGFAMAGVYDPPPVDEGLPIEQLRSNIHPDDLPDIADATSAALERGAGVVDGTARYRQPDGSYRVLLSRRIAERDEDGQPVALIGCSLDVTERYETLERMRSAEKRAAIAAAHAGFGVWSYDLVTREMRWDDNMYRMRGYDPQGHPGLQAVREQTMDAEGRAALQARMDGIADRVLAGEQNDDKPTSIQFKIRHLDGSERWISSTASVVREPGRHPLLMGMHSDVTDSVLADELRRQRAAADDANQAKSRFLANMSHEIRTPMNAILGMAHLALRTPLDAQQRNYVEKIERSATALLGLINEILDFSKIEADKIELERVPFQLDDVLKDLANLVGLSAGNKGLELVFALPPTLPSDLIGDPMRLGQVLVNLVSNAVKFTERGEVVLAVEALPTPLVGAATLRFSVSDSGSGMTAQHLERLFQPFEQADASTSRQHGGTGLGLAICQRLVRTMGGQLEVDSAPGRGSRFAFNVTFDLPDMAAPSPRRFLGERTLVVDDHEQARAALVDLCRAAGLHPVGVADAHLAFAAARRTPFELVLIDAEMPGMDGVACALQLSAWMQPPPAIVLMSSASAREGVSQRLARDGLAHCGVLAKPVLPSALFEVALAALGRAVPAIAAAPPPAAAEPPRERLRGVRVLLVDDNDINQELACEILSNAGMEVRVAGDGRAAIEALAQHPFDVVLMDCQMPVMDGYEATEVLRRDPRHAALPIIAMTANVMSGDRDRALASGMNDHIAKPIDIDALFATLDRWLVKP